MPKIIQKDVEARMQKSIESLKDAFAKVRTGRANAGLLDHIKIDYYGNPTPLNQVATINAVDARTLLVSPWEKNLLPVIEKAISQADLGLNPASVGQDIRVPMPFLTEERRRDMIKLVKQEAEQAKVAVRNVRRDANKQFQQLLKDKSITEDEERQNQDAVQKLTDEYIKNIDSVLQAKEADLLAI